MTVVWLSGWLSIIPELTLTTNKHTKSMFKWIQQIRTHTHAERKFKKENSMQPN